MAEDKALFSTTKYDINKAAYSAQPAITRQQYYDNYMHAINEMICNTNNQYYMLLNNDKHYYTICSHVHNHYSSPDYAAEEFYELLASLGELVGIEVLDDHIEFWIKDKNKKADVYMFFPYDIGVVEI